MKINTGCLVNGCKCFNPNDEDGVWIKKDRDWVELTNEEIEEIYTNAMSDFDFIFDTQAKLKEKNSTTMRNIQTSDKND